MEISKDYLKELLLLSKLNETSTENDIKSEFDKIAKILLLHTEIAIGDDIRYTLEEIEFYYYKKGVFEKNYNTCTYPRDCNALDFFWHYSGVDICFQSYENAFGGILIRSLRKKKNNIDEGLIGGPMRCSTELINNCVNTNHKIKIIVNKEQIKENVTPWKTTIRQGIKSDYKIKDRAKKTINPLVEYCYYNSQGNDWKRDRINEYVLVKDKNTNKKFYKKGPKTDYYKDNPECRISNIEKTLNKETSQNQ